MQNGVRWVRERGSEAGVSCALSVSNGFDPNSTHLSSLAATNTVTAVPCRVIDHVCPMLRADRCTFGFVVVSKSGPTSTTHHPPPTHHPPTTSHPPTTHHPPTTLLVVLCQNRAPLQDGAKLFSGSCDNTIRVWSVATGKPLQVLDSHSNCEHHLPLSRTSTRGCPTRCTCWPRCS